MSGWHQLSLQVMDGKMVANWQNMAETREIYFARYGGNISSSWQIGRTWQPEKFILRVAKVGRLAEYGRTPRSSPFKKKLIHTLDIYRITT